MVEFDYRAGDRSFFRVEKVPEKRFQYVGAQSFGGTGVAPTILSVVATNSTTVRITFGQRVISNAALSHAASYSISTTGHTPTISAVTPQPVTQPIYVDLTCSELIQGAAYTAQIDLIEVA